MLIPAFVVHLSIEIFMPFGNKYYDFSGQMGHYWHFEQRKGTLCLHEYSLRATRIFVQGCLHICSWSRVYSLIVARHVEVLADLHRVEVKVERAVGPSGSGGELASEHARMALHPPGLHLDERVERAAVLSLAVDGVLNTEIAANCFHKIGQLALLQPESAFRWVI